jgi:hypothetical protein
VINAIKFSIEEIEASDQYFDHTRAKRPAAQTVTPHEAGSDKHPMPWNFSNALTKM